MGFVAHFGGRFVSVQSWDCIPNLGMWDEKISNHNNEWMSECFGIKEASRFMPDRILSLIALFMRITWSYIILRPSYPPPLSWIGRRHEWLHENSRGKWGRKHWCREWIWVRESSTARQKREGGYDNMMQRMGGWERSDPLMGSAFEQRRAFVHHSVRTTALSACDLWWDRYGRAAGRLHVDEEDEDWGCC